MTIVTTVGSILHGPHAAPVSSYSCLLSSAYIELRGLARPFEMFPCVFNWELQCLCAFGHCGWIAVSKRGGGGRLARSSTLKLTYRGKLDTYILVTFVAERGRYINNNSNKKGFCSSKGLFPKNTNSMAVSSGTSFGKYQAENQWDVKTFKKAAA